MKFSGGDFVHATRDLFEARLLCGRALEHGITVVEPKSAVDPDILKITCPECAAIVSADLRMDG